MRSLGIVRFAWGSLLAGLLAGCAQQMPHVVERPITKDTPYCILFIVDGLSPALLEVLEKNGDIPNIKKYILDRGLKAQNMVSVFPSITAGAITSMLTGTHPGHHKIPNFTWVDRNTCEYRCYIGGDIEHFESDLYENAMTIFQYLPKDETASFGFIQGRQAGKDDSLMYSALNPFHEYAPLSHIFINDLFSKIGVGSGVPVPHLLAYYEWAADIKSHQVGKGQFSQDVHAVMKRVDHQIGRIVRAYQRRGLFDKTYLILASDHGMMETRENLDMEEEFDNAGFKEKVISYNLGEWYIPDTWDRADSLLWSRGKVTEMNVVIGSAGGGNATLDLVRDGGLDKNGQAQVSLWREHPVYDELLKYDLGFGTLVKERYINVIRFIRDLKGVDFFVVRENRPKKGEDLKVLVVSQKGLARITRRLKQDVSYEYAYEVVKGSDPLEYVRDEKINKLIQSGYHDGDAWFDATAESAYPDGPFNLTAMFDTERSGTLVVSMKTHWSVHSKIADKHGGYNREEMIGVFAISGPGLSHGSIYKARLTDITPTILYLLNELPARKRFDGKPIPELVQQLEKQGKPK